MRINLSSTLCLGLIFNFTSICEETPSDIYRGKAGPTGWKCHVIQADPKDHGPDGMNWHDWDGDGHKDVFVNFEEGKMSRLYFNPGPDQYRKAWKEFITFSHGKCEDSGIGDLDDDGDTDYIANGGIVYFNPGQSQVKLVSSWNIMTLFKQEGRAPTVADINNDGLLDLLVAGNRWYQQPVNNKHDAKFWKEHKLGDAKWVMNNIHYDMDKDGLKDIVVQDRRNEIFWYKNPGPEKVTQPWPRFSIHKNNDSMFMLIEDVNLDGNDDIVITCGKEGHISKQTIFLIRTNSKGLPSFKEIALSPAKTDYYSINDYFPKGVLHLDVDGNPNNREIVFLPKKGDMWYVSYQGDPLIQSNWKTTSIPTPGSTTRLKMDNIYPCDIDNDGDIDFGTTEENGGWGVIWFENPEK